MIARFPYGGNGGYSSEIPELADWLVETVMEMKEDSRISEVIPWRISDTPISMCRNRAVIEAKKNGCDFLLMIDSDNVPDYELNRGDKTAKPFWKTAFDFLYSHYDKGPAVIAAPYCGPPPHENVYVFQISNRESEHAGIDFKIDQFSRNQAAERTGIEKVAALPTGLILFDVRAFDSLPPPWFYYEWTNKFECEKASTEDVTATRDMMFHIHQDKGYLPLYVAWDCWAGHVKPKIVGKPQIMTSDQVSEKLAEAVRRKDSSKERTLVMDGLSKFLAAGATPWKSPKAEAVQPPSMPSESESPDEWQTPEWMLEKFGFTPQADLQVLRRLVQDSATRLGRDPIVMELGTYIGQSTKAMAMAGAIVFTVDNRDGSPHDGTFVQYAMHGPETIVDALKQNIKSLEYRSIHLIVGDSIECASLFRKQIDILYVDADHDYEPTKANILAWMKHVRDGGIVAGHDYCDLFPGVVKAVDELFPDAHVDGSVWWTVKSAAKPAVNRLAPLSYPEYEEDVPETIANGHAG